MQKINKINQNLLEKFPNIWNTRIVWMLLLGIAVHLIFFFIGFVSHASPSTLQHSGAVNDYLTSGLIFVHIIISVLMIVGWLVYMFKNNAFKSFYPSSGRKLFFEFVQYFIIVFVSTTFYFSYMSGFKLFINYKFDDEKMAKNIDVINRANPFLSQEIELYTLEQRKYPKEFSNFYCETNINKIDKNGKYFVYHDRVYQYFSLYQKKVTVTDSREEFKFPEEEKKNKIPLAYFETSRDGKTRTYYFKKAVVDLSLLIKSTAPSYYNFSDVLYDIRNNPSTTIRKYRYENGIENDENLNELKKQKVLVNQQTAQLLDSKNPKALQELLQNFLDISREFDIRNNLNAKDWSAMVNHSDKFEVKNFIKKYQQKAGVEYDPNKAPDGHYDYEVASVDSTAVGFENQLNENGEIVKDTVNARDFNPNLDREVSPADYFKKNLSNYYYYTTDLRLFLENVDTIKSNDFFSEMIHFFIWLAFSLGAFIFSFRITNIRSLLFSIVSSGVIVLVVTLFCVASAFVFNMTSKFFIFYTMLIVGAIILLLPFITLKRFPKLFSSIFMIMSINAFPIFIWLVLVTINEHQTADCYLKNLNSDDDYRNCLGFLDEYGFTLSYLILFVTLLFLYFYTSFIKKWKALPE